MNTATGPGIYAAVAAISFNMRALHWLYMTYRKTSPYSSFMHMFPKTPLMRSLKRTGISLCGKVKPMQRYSC